MLLYPFLAKMKGPNVRVIDGGEDLFDLRKSTFVIRKIDGITAFEINLNEDQTLVVFALNGLKESTAT